MCDQVDGAMISRHQHPLRGVSSGEVSVDGIDQVDGAMISRHQHPLRRVSTDDGIDLSETVPLDDVDAPLRPSFDDEGSCHTRSDVSNELTGCTKCTSCFWNLPVLRHVPRTDHDRALDCLIAGISFCLCLSEVGLEVKLLWEYHTSHQHLIFYLTLSFIGISTFVVGIFTLLWTIIDLQQPHGQTDDRTSSLGTCGAAFEPDRNLNSHRTNSCHSKTKLRICRVFFSFLQFGRAFRLAEYLYNMYQGWKSKRKDENRIRKAEVELRDAAIIGLLEAYLETTLKFLLQLYLKFSTEYETRTRDLFLLVSLVSISVSVTSCYMTNRKLNQPHESVKFSSILVYVMMRLFELGPRLILPVLCIQVAGWWTLIGISLHLVLMFVFNACYVYPENNNMCNCRCTCCFYLFLSYVEVFSFINMNKEESKRTAILYYLVFYLENAMMMSLVLCLTYNGNVPCMPWCMLAYSAIPGFVLHLFCLYLFYSCLHPTRNRDDN